MELTLKNSEIEIECKLDCPKCHTDLQFGLTLDTHSSAITRMLTCHKCGNAITVEIYALQWSIKAKIETTYSVDW